MNVKWLTGAVAALLLGCSPDPSWPGIDSESFPATDSGGEEDVLATDDGPQTDTASFCPAQGGALSTCLQPRQPPEYYVAEALKYFDTLDATAKKNNAPAYSALVARWEWPPWLKLTGYGRQMMTYTDKLLMIAMPSTVPVRDCRAFPVQPFARCRVSFDYDGRACPIYEEFTFNDEGETTFIEAWSDAPHLLPMADETDLWGEGPAVHRMSTKLPGLGDPHGRISLRSEWMRRAAEQDPEIADFVKRANSFWTTWYDEYQSAGPDLFKRGCGW